MHRDDAESAVSAVVGAVLLLALFASAMTIYTVQTLPDWKADKEHNQQLEVQAQMAGLRSDIEALAARREAGPVTTAIPLETPRVPVLQSVPARASLGIEDGFGATFAFPTAPTLYLSDGASTAVPTLTAGSLPAAPCSGKCVQDLQAFVLGIATSGVASGSVTGTITFVDSASTPATVTVQVAHLATAGTCPGEVRLTVGTSVTTLLCTGTGTAVGSTANPHRIDLLNNVYGLSGALARLQAPFSVAFATSGTPGTITLGHAMVFEDSDGALRVTGTGTSTPAPVQEVDGKRLVYSPNYHAFPSQDLVLEGGALVIDAGPTSQALVGDAAFTVAVSSGVGSLSWTLVDLQGSGAIGGGREAVVSATYDGVEDVVFTLPSSCSPCATMTLATPGATAWGNFAALQAGLAGVSDSLSATVDTDAETLVLQPSSGASLTVTSGWVVHLRIIHVTLGVS